MGEVKKITISNKTMDEGTLPDVQNHGDIDELHLTFNKELVLNSIGIRHWIKWITPFSENFATKIFLYECSMAMIHQVNLIANFLPKNAQIMSLYVRYISNTSDEETLVLLKKGVDYDIGKLNLPKPKDKAGEEMECDVVEERYFRFTLQK